MNVIPLTAAMSEAEKGKPFDVTFCTADYRRKTAGEVVELKRVFLKPLTDSGETKSTSEKNTAPIADNSKKPSHRQNDTRNLLLSNGKTRKFHPRLMLTYNGMEVVY